MNEPIPPNKQQRHHQGTYKSVSAFAPIAHPSACPWGVKAFTGYLGEDRAAWEVRGLWDWSGVSWHFKGAVVGGLGGWVGSPYLLSHKYPPTPGWLIGLAYLLFP